MSGEGSGSAQGKEKEKEKEEEENVEEDIALRRRPWTREEDDKLSQMVELHGAKNWTLISAEIPGRSNRSCRHRWFYKFDPNVERRPFTAEEDDILALSLRRRPWTPEEDDKLEHMLDLHGSNWPLISSKIPGRSDRACQQRWWRKLTPNGERRLFTAEEDDIILRARRKHGNEWAEIVHFLPGRTSTSIQNRWYSNLRWRKRPAEGSQQQQQDLSSVGTSASSSSHSEIDFIERKRLCQREEEDVETPNTAATMNLLEPDPITSLSPSLLEPGRGGDGGGSLKGKEKKNEDC